MGRERNRRTPGNMGSSEVLPPAGHPGNPVNPSTTDVSGRTEGGVGVAAGALGDGLHGAPGPAGSEGPPSAAPGIAAPSQGEPPAGDRETLPDPWEGWSAPYEAAPGVWRRFRPGPFGLPVEVAEVPAP